MVSKRNFIQLNMRTHNKKKINKKNECHSVREAVFCWQQSADCQPTYISGLLSSCISQSWCLLILNIPQLCDPFLPQESRSWNETIKLKFTPPDKKKKIKFKLTAYETSSTALTFRHIFFIFICSSATELNVRTDHQTTQSQK